MASEMCHVLRAHLESEPDEVRSRGDAFVRHEAEAEVGADGEEAVKSLASLDE